MLNLKDNAIFIADSHYNIQRTELLTLLTHIKSGDIQTNQLFLMGDMFDFLSSKFSYFIKQNQKVIDLLNYLSNDLEIIYFEGNHDFRLAKLFPNILIIPREQQPYTIKNDDKTIALAHGDIFTPIIYNIFTKLLRSNIFLELIDLIDINYWFSKKLENKLMVKNICHKQKDFDDFILKRIESYNIELIIEGHYHQGKIQDNYINIPSLACDNKYIRFSKDIFTYQKLED